MSLFDSHCHLQDATLLPRIDDVILRAHQAGLIGFCCCGSSETDWPIVQELCARFSDIVPAFGLHPWYIAARTPNWRNLLTDLLKTWPGACVGEIGLDRAIKDRNDQDQVEVFVAQMQIAQTLARPASIHCRRAWDLMPQLLKDIGSLPSGFVIHSYSGSAELVEPLAELGASFSFSGSITYELNKRGRSALLAVPLERLLIETDAPDIMPVIGSQRNSDAPNEPSNLVYILRKVAELRGIPADELAEQVWKNAERIFVARK
jgi:TatD DNase family protein